MQSIETSSRPGRVPAAGLDFLLREMKLSLSRASKFNENKGGLWPPFPCKELCA
jgi:hypothetical protein